MSHYSLQIQLFQECILKSNMGEHHKHTVERLSQPPFRFSAEGMDQLAPCELLSRSCVLTFRNINDTVLETFVS